MAIEEKLDFILGELRTINKRLDHHEQLLTQLVGIVKVTNERLTVVEEKVTKIEYKMTVMEEKVTNIESDISEIRSGQERQNRILESLAMRSLEQETDIRELRRAK